jgi:hypothetical protein
MHRNFKARDRYFRDRDRNFRDLFVGGMVDGFVGLYVSGSLRIMSSRFRPCLRKISESAFLNRLIADFILKVFLPARIFLIVTAYLSHISASYELGYHSIVFSVQAES